MTKRVIEKGMRREGIGEERWLKMDEKEERERRAGEGDMTKEEMIERGIAEKDEWRMKRWSNKGIGKERMETKGRKNRGRSKME